MGDTTSARNSSQSHPNSTASSPDAQGQDSRLRYRNRIRENTEVNAMAKVHPPLASIRPTSAGEYAEYEILKTLADGLPDAYELFHGVHWAAVHVGRDSHGELDIVVVNNAGDVAVLEVKAGKVLLNEQGTFKRYGVQSKDIGQQARMQFGAVQHRLRAEGLSSGRLLHLLVLPDQRVDVTGSITFPRERIADAEDCMDLPGFVQRRLGAGQGDALRKRVCAFFANRLGLEPDVSALCGQLHARVAQISGGLADWVPRIEAPSRVVRIQATAGSGKTQLALRLLRLARERGQRATYVCFNRPLADHLREIAPPGTLVMTFHQLCWEAAGRPQQSGVHDFERLARHYVDQSGQAHTQADWDLLVIDELQDLQPQWVQALLDRLRDDAALYLLDDPAQCLYPDRQEIDIAQAVVVRSQENYRSPRRVVETINLLRLSPEPVLACGPYEGEHLEPTIYQADGGGSLMCETARAVQRCMDKGFALSDITVLSWRGRDKSRLLAQEQLADWRLARFNGGYDDQGRPLWSEGDLRAETVRRFKGQAAEAVVITEVDFEELNEERRNLLFVGLTRARMHVELVLSPAAASALEARLQLL